jgi:MerR family transcriptional regulator, light-induced transcriptional regulator
MTSLTVSSTEYADELFLSLVAGAGERALGVLDRAEDALPLPLVAVEVIQPALDRIGEAWRHGEIGVAEEHFSTEVLRAWILHAGRRTAATGPAVLLACVEGERHALGVDLLHMLLRREGWASVNLGADVPTDALRRAVADSVFRPRAVLLSAGMRQHVPALIEAVAALADLPAELRPLIAYGGRPFRDDPSAVRGATWLAPDAAGALPALRGLLEVATPGRG